MPVFHRCEQKLKLRPFNGQSLLLSPDEQLLSTALARALSEDEIRKLITSAKERPLLDAWTIGTGPNKGKLLAKVSDAVRERLERTGRERALN